MPAHYDNPFTLFLLWILYLAKNDGRRYALSNVVEATFDSQEQRILFRQFFQYVPELINSPDFHSFTPRSTELQLIPKAKNPGRITILFSADSIYFKQKLLKFNRDALLESDPDLLTVHVNLIDPDPICLRELDELCKHQSIHGSISSSHDYFESNVGIKQNNPLKIHRLHTFFASNRFIILPTVMALHQTPIIVLDVDLEFPKGLNALAQFYLDDAGYDVAIRQPRRRRAPGFDYWLHESAYKNTGQGLAFASILSKYIRFFFENKEPLWTLDQCAFNATFTHFEQTFEQIYIRDLGTQAMRDHHGLTFHRGGRDQLIGLRDYFFANS